MAIALVNETTDGLGAHGGTSSEISAVGGNLLTAIVSYYGLGTMQTTDVSDSSSNTWLALTRNSSTAAFNQQIFYCLSPTVTASHTVTISDGSTYPAVNFAAWSGVDSYDSESGAMNTSGTTIQPGSITPSANGSLLITGLCHNTTATSTIGSGYTELTSIARAAGVNMGLEAAYLVQATAAAINPTWTMSAGQEKSTSMACFLAAAGSQSIVPIIHQLMSR